MKKLIIFILVAGSVLFIALNKSSTVLLNANHLVAFYNPWAGDRSGPWGLRVHQKPVGKDDLWIFYPQRTFTNRALQIFHEIPLWNPFSFSGNHHAGLSETAVFYPLNLLFFILPQISAWTILMLLEPIILSIGMYLFLQKILKDPVASLFGAMVFSGSSIGIVRMIEGISVGHSLIWLPYILWCVESFAQQRRLRYVIFLILALVWSLTAGWFQYTFYITVVGILYAIYRENKLLTPILLPFILYPFFALFHLVPSLAAFLESPRGGGVDVGHLILHLAPIQHLVTLLFPDLWGSPATFNYFGRMPYKEPLMAIGIVPLALALVGLRNPDYDKRLRFFVWMLGIALLFGIDNPISRLVVALPIPIVSTFIPARVLVIVSFSLSVFAAVGMRNVLRKSESHVCIFRSIVRYICILSTVLLIVFWSVYWIVSRLDSMPTFVATLFQILKVHQLLIQARNAVIPTGIIGMLWVALFIKRSLVKMILAVVWLLTIIQIVYSTHKYIPISQSTFVYPPHPVFTFLSKHIGYNRFITSGSGHIESNIPLQFHIPSPEGAGSMYIGRYGELLSYVTDPQRRTTQVLRIESYINPPTQKLLTGQDPVMQRFLRLDGARYIVALAHDRDVLTESDIAESAYHIVWQNDDWQIWEDTEALPRVFLTADFRIKATKDAILNEIFSLNTPARRIVIEQNPMIDSHPEVSGTARISTYTPNSITITAQSDKPALVYLSDTYSRWFEASVDGKKAPLLRANYAFRAVPIPAGSHTIVMKYAAFWWNIGTSISIVFWIGGIMLCVILVKRV